ncbi:peptidoglycan recognition protein [Streptomyces sp. NRRL B-3648]|uniref:peptidoglycan recognition protein family protein n=1 Tax=Streptomyces sp. NRRL B-3648 TaxID=1519493 RepID=UPI0006ADADCD|nr:peptidoglycan recognition protein [Streptomyces sp. NRRL B-3648]KOV98811.1 N-acetylmuramoyl-L-alanine amidase family protein [Streptomyces sp. NRRL B-3648]
MSKIMHMRGFLPSCPGVSPLTARSIGVTFAAVVALAPALPASAAPAPAGAAVPGSTRSLPLVPLARERVLGGAPGLGLHRTGLARFALVGVVWDDPGSELHGRVRVRTRSAATGRWSGWQDVETHTAGHGADPGTAEGSARRLRGATAPLWVGESDGVDVRVRAEGPQGAAGSRAGGPPRSPLPSGLRLELVDPGNDGGDGTNTGDGDAGAGEAGVTEASDAAEADDPPGTALDTEAAIAASGANADITDFGATTIPELDREATERELARLQGTSLDDPARAKPYIGPRPRIVTRRGWGADESLREHGFVYTAKVKAAFVHHTASGNAYTCAQAPSVIRSIYRYHVKSMGWRDIGYNFLVDKCGTIYEGRAGGVAKAVLGAHTLGFNTNSTGIAVIGTYGSVKPSGSAVTAVARLTAWKLGLYGANPLGKTYLTSGGGNLYPKGKNVRLNVISGHRDGFATECPGKLLYARLGTARSSAAAYQGR